MIKARLYRNVVTDESTIGEFFACGRKFYSLERPWLGNQPNISCIPAGEYLLKWHESPKYGMCYEVTAVEGRTRILIHAGNYPKDTLGCILLGCGFGENAVFNSRKAITQFHDLTKGEDVQLLIVDGSG